MSLIIDNDLLDMMRKIEVSCDIKILHASVIGSYNTGLNRPNSDIDIMFVYADRIDRYFDLVEPKQTVMLKTGNYDITAFSLKKTVEMIVKSNPAIIHLLTAKNKIISVPKTFRQLEGFTKEYFSPVRLYMAFLGIMNRTHIELTESKDAELKVFLTYVRAALALHHCSCYGMIKNDFLTLVRLSPLTDKTKTSIYGFVNDYKGGKTHTYIKSLTPAINEIEKLTRNTEFKYSAAPIIGQEKIRDFHKETILELMQREE